MKLTARSSSTVMSDPAETDAPSDGKPMEARWAVTTLINDSKARFNRKRFIVWDLERRERWGLLIHRPRVRELYNDSECQWIRTHRRQIWSKNWCRHQLPFNRSFKASRLVTVKATRIFLSRQQMEIMILGAHSWNGRGVLRAAGFVFVYKWENLVNSLRHERWKRSSD